MSKIEVNTVAPQCGTTLTLGESGDTVTLGAGASQSGFGRTGTVDWDTTAKTASFTAVSGNGYFVNTTSGAITVTLPAGSAGAIVSFADYAATWQTYNVTVAPNGTDKIGSLNQNAVLSTEGQSVTFVYVDGTQGWINTMDSTSNVRGVSPFMCASISGACNTLVTAPDCANTKIATFTGPGNFIVNTVGSLAANNVVSYMIVAGGGGGNGAGSNYTAGGGGGAGGFREFKSPVTPYTASPLEGSTPITVSATSYPIVIGAGGTGPGSYTSQSPAGTPSTALGITATGGGGARGYCSVGPVNPIANGGSGGGGGGFGTSTGGAGNTPPVSPSQGNPGGNGGGSQDSSVFAGGGGGATVSGVTGSSGVGGNGGAGATTSISGSPTAYAGGGGGGGMPTKGCGGVGGGGDGSTTTLNPNRAGTANTGGGGGGAIEFTSGPGPAGGNGGSGIVIIRYKFQ